MKIRYLAFIALLLTPTVAAAKPAKFRLGISAPLSGVLAEYGVAVRNGVELAKKNHPELLDRIDIVFEDSQWDPKTALSAFKTLAEVKQASLIFNWGNPTTEAIAPLAERGQFPTIAMSSDPKVAHGRKFLVRSIPSGASLGALLGKHLTKRGLRHVEVIVAENSYVQGLYEGLEAELKSAGGSVGLLERCALSQQDFRSLITKAKTKHYDALGVFLITGQVSSFYRQLSNLGAATTPTFGADFHGSKTEVAAAGPAIEGAVFPDLGVTEAFRAQYTKEFGNDVELSFAANSHDIVTIVAKQFGGPEAATLNAEQVMSRVRAGALPDGAHGGMTFSDAEPEGPHFVTPLVIRRVQGGEIVGE